MDDPLSLLSAEDGFNVCVRAENHFFRRKLACIVALDRAEAWKPDGVHSMVDWLVFACNVSRSMARDWVEAGYALERLPAIDQAFLDGLLSFEQVRLLIRFATPDTDDELARVAIDWSISFLKYVLRHQTPITSPEEEEARSQRSLRTIWDKERGMLKIWGRFHAADGMVVEKALQREVERYRVGAEEAARPSFEHQYADAFVRLCSERVAEDSDADRATVVCYVDAKTLVTGDGNAALEGGIVVGAETLRRLSCDARLRVVEVGSDGEPIGIGRVSRTVPPWLYAELRRRDVGCIYKECGRTRGLNAHHVIPWEDGGRTNLDNLVL